jgi:hypothetical protein
MNKQQRKEWEQLVEACASTAMVLREETQQSVVAANAYIMKLERELQNIKGGRKIAAILKSKVSV